LEGFATALLAAYPTLSGLDQVLFYRLDRSLAEYVGNVGTRDAVFALIRAARAEGWLADLVDAVHADRPGNDQVQRWVAANGSISVAVTGQDHAAADSTLERTIRPHVPDLDPADLRRRIEQAEARVCRVETDTPAGPRALGTGVLIGAGLCLTAFHVVARRSGADLRLRFDHRSATDPGEVFGLEQDWLADASPHSDVDELADPAGRLPAPGELDHAVLRVAGEPGKQPGRSGEPRGWIESVRVEAPAPYDDLFVLHHPDGGPLRLSIGPLLDLNTDGTRLRHAVNTAPGSSGAPCFDVGLALVAMHQGGDPDFRPLHRPTHNRAVPIHAIRSALPLELAVF